MLLGLESLNVQFLASNYPIDLIFIHMIEEAISILYIKYVSNLKIFTSLSFLKFYGIAAFFGLISLVQSKFLRKMYSKGKNESI